LKMIEYNGEGSSTMKKLCKKYGGLKMSGAYLMTVRYDPKNDILEISR